MHDPFVEQAFAHQHRFDMMTLVGRNIGRRGGWFGRGHDG
jgi:hypothetical protein